MIRERNRSGDRHLNAVWVMMVNVPPLRNHNRTTGKRRSRFISSPPYKISGSVLITDPDYTEDIGRSIWRIGEGTHKDIGGNIGEGMLMR